MLISLVFKFYLIDYNPFCQHHKQYARKNTFWLASQQSCINLVEIQYLQYKEYSITPKMESSQLKLSQFQPNPHSPLPKPQTVENQCQQVVRQRKDSGCNLREQIKGEEMDSQNEMLENEGEGVAAVNFWRMLLIGVTLGEFSIEIGVIVIQYISSKITLAPFVASTAITLLLLSLVVFSLALLSPSKISSHAKTRSQNQRHDSSATNKSSNSNPTLQKIKNNALVRQIQKTMKLKSLAGGVQKQVENSQTFKQLAHLQPQHQQIQNQSFLPTISVHANMYLIIVTKSLQLLFSLIACTICFCTLENPTINGIGYMSLLLIFYYVLASFSFAVMVCLCFKIQQNILKPSQQNKNQQLMVNIKRECQMIADQVGQFQKNVHTILSIDKYIPTSSREERKGKEKEFMKSIENIIKNDENCDNVKSNPNQLAQNVTTEVKNAKKFLSHRQGQDNQEAENKDPQVKVAKKSMLKSTRKFANKGQTSKCEENNNQLQVQRKKVEINSKKIEYFEYANISPANEGRYADEQHKPYFKAVYQKSKVVTQRSIYFQQKIMNEEQLLERMRQENNKRSIRSANSGFRMKENKRKSEQSQSNNSHILNFLP